MHARFIVLNMASCGVVDTHMKDLPFASPFDVGAYVPDHAEHEFSMSRDERTSDTAKTCKPQTEHRLKPGRNRGSLPGHRSLWLQRTNPRE